jgi:acyl carrier protein
MLQTEKIYNAIYNAIDEVNETLPKEKRIVKDKETVIYDPDGYVDSLGLTMLIVAVEQKVEEELGVMVTLVDANAMSYETSPFRTVNLLANHILGLMGKKEDV